MKRAAGLANVFSKKFLRNAAIVLVIAVVAYVVMYGVKEGFQAANNPQYTYFNTAKANQEDIIVSTGGRRIKNINIEVYDGKNYVSRPVTFNSVQTGAGLETTLPGKRQAPIPLNDALKTNLSILVFKRLNNANLNITKPFDDKSQKIDEIKIDHTTMGAPTTRLQDIRLTENKCLDIVNNPECIVDCLKLDKNTNLNTMANNNRLMVTGLHTTAAPQNKKKCETNCTQKLIRDCIIPRYANGRIVIEYQ